MRALPVLAAIAAIAVVPLSTARTLMAATAGTLLEAAPFLLAGCALAALSWRAGARLLPYLGCGCGTDAAARSLPAAAATWLAFGPLVAGARFITAVAIARRRGFDPEHRHAHHSAPLPGLRSLLPAALTASVLLDVVARQALLVHAGRMTAFAVGLVLGALSSPCALGSVGIASALRATAPFAAAGVLCTAGLFDVRFLRRDQAPAHGDPHDAIAYALAAAACAFTAAHGGATLVHPRFIVPLWVCACGFASLCVRYRLHANARARVAPALMLAGALLGAPMPLYTAGETNLADAFAGERLTFTGQVVRTKTATTLVRYAITCCRADAAPVAVVLDEPEPAIRGWARATGTLVRTGGGLRLHAGSITRVAAPADPFVYR